MARLQFVIGPVALCLILPCPATRAQTLVPPAPVPAPQTGAGTRLSAPLPPLRVGPPTIVTPPEDVVRLRAAALAAFDAGNLVEAEQLFLRTLAAARTTGRSPADVDILRFDLALTVDRVDRARAAPMYEALIRSATDRGDADMMSRAHSALAANLRQTGDSDKAREHAMLAFHLAETSHNPVAQAGAARVLGTDAWLRGNLTEAVRHYALARDLFQAAGSADHTAETLATLAQLEVARNRLGVAQGYVEDGLRLCACAGARLQLLFARAAVADQRGELALAERSYAELAELPTIRSVPMGRAAALANLCAVRVRLHAESAEASCDDALRETAAQGARDALARTAYALATRRYEAGRHAESLELLRRALAMIEANCGGGGAFAVQIRAVIEQLNAGLPADLPSLDPRRVRVGDQNASGTALYARQDYAGAELLYVQALAGARDLKDEDAEAMVLGNLGYLRLAQHRYGEARAYAEQSLARSERIGAKARTRVQLWLLGQAQAIAGSRDAARKTLWRGFDMVRGVDGLLEAQYLVSLATIEETDKRWAEAARLFLQAEGAAQRMGDQSGRAAALVRAAEAEAKLSLSDRAERHLGDALAAARSVGSTQAEQAVWLLQGEIDQRRARYDDARRHFLAALQLALQARAPRETRTSYDRLIALAERQHDAPSAAAWRKERDEVLVGSVMAQLRAARLAYALADMALQRGARDEGRFYLQRAVKSYRAIDQAATDEGRRAEQRLADLH